MFHFFLLPVAAITIVLAVYNLIRNFSFSAAWMFVLSIAFAVLIFKARVYALKAQDRVIRLEERLRLAMLLPEQLRSRIPELTEGQLVALRFAPDDEVAALADKALSSKMRYTHTQYRVKGRIGATRRKIQLPRQLNGSVRPRAKAPAWLRTVGSRRYRTVSG